VHSITVQDRRRMLHAWNIFLVISTFSLSLLGTFLVRSGVLSSVHAFAVDPGRGAYILAFMTIVLGVSFGIFLARGRYQQAEESVTSLLSRESLFVWNNVLFILACAIVLLGTLAPLAVDAFSEAKLTVAAPYFNEIMVPIFLVVILLMAIGPLVPWRKANPQRLKQHLLVPVLIGIATAIAMVIAFPSGHWTGPVGAGLALLAAAALATDYLRAILQRRAQLSESWARAAGKTVLGNRRHYGGMIVHFGIVIVTLGLVGSGLFRSEASVVMKDGDVLEVAGERLRFDGVRADQRANYRTVEARLTLLNSGRVVYPERRVYARQEAPMTESAIDSTPLRDVYVVLGEPLSERRWTVRVYVNPLVQLIWIGAMVMLTGLGLSLSGRRRKVAAKDAVEATAAAAVTK
jgi:cytochrome c-type biogenesis protein CcmF